MRKFILLSFLVFANFAVYASPEVADTSSSPEVAETDWRMARFLAGVTLIRSVPAMGAMERAERFRELESVVGVTASDAAVFLEECRSAPERWRLFSGLVLSILTEISGNTTVGETPSAPVQ